MSKKAFLKPLRIKKAKEKLFSALYEEPQKNEYNELNNEEKAIIIKKVLDAFKDDFSF